MTDSEDCQWYRITGLQHLSPFFLSLVGAGDGWAFLSSTGAITAGRRSPDHAVFPYRTADQLLDAHGSCGSFTRICSVGEGRQEWQALGSEPSPTHPRQLLKTVLGDEVRLSEEHPELGVSVQVGWRHSPRFGLVRTTTIASQRCTPVELQIVDGLLNVLPPGATARVQRELSVLLDAYKISELDEEAGLAWTRLNSGLTDLAEPVESLLATTMWCHHPAGARLSLLPDPEAVTRTRGVRANLVLRHHTVLEPGQSLQWQIIVDTDRDAGQVADLRLALARPEAVLEELSDDLHSARTTLTAMVDACDGRQYTADRAADAHHAASVLFNVMRGGGPTEGLAVTAGQLRDYLERRHRGITARCQAQLAGLTEHPTAGQIREIAARATDPDLRRLLSEHLPLTFSRRHGDPTRPWNHFDIRLTDERGRPISRFEGNWRDIFQNWEALGYSYPELIDPMIRVFLNAMTIDGYNPYRISTDGVDWEVPEPDNPWSNIGYWGDHQVVYLHHLIEARQRLSGAWTSADLAVTDYVYAAVPYRIADYHRLRDGDGAAVTFDEQADHLAQRRHHRLGGDGRLLTDSDATLIRTTLAEKLLLIVAAKLVNLVPAAGIWMNTQRPEWNDANNALAGRGVSTVTAYQLSAFVQTLLGIFDAGDLSAVPVSTPLRQLWGDLDEILAGEVVHSHHPNCSRARRSVMDRLGVAGQRYRHTQYAAPQGGDDTLDITEVRQVLERAQLWLRATQVTRSDGLAASYATLRFTDDRVEVDPLGPMLEGQAAAVGRVEPDTAVRMLQALRDSPLWCDRRHSYLLYPDRAVPGFLQRNAIPVELEPRLGPLVMLADTADRRLVTRSHDGVLRFGGRLRNRADVAAVLGELADDDRWAEAVRQHGDAVQDVFDDVFEHRSFTGRAGSFFGYEGLGSIYWHMVSKLLLAVHTRLDSARTNLADPASIAGLSDAAADIRRGLGHAKSPAQFGAVPIDPYSHTPEDGNARQPGMTGQVKEDILIRWHELGMRFADGTVEFHPEHVDASQWLTAPTRAEFAAAGGGRLELDLAADTLAFTWCATPIVYRRTGQRRLLVHYREPAETVTLVTGNRLPPSLAGAVMARAGTVHKIEVG